MLVDRRARPRSRDCRGRETRRGSQRPNFRAARHGRHRLFHPSLKASAGGKANVVASLHKPWRRSESHDRAATIRIGRRRAFVDDRRLRALRCDTKQRRRARRRTHPGTPNDPVHALLAPGHGFGLGFGVRLQYGLAMTPGSVGDYFWGGWAGTTFRVSPQDSLFAIFMTQAPDNREHFGWTFGNLLNAAIL
jgi:CubicO group peptidase (beta-lactamase class C family)